MTHSNTSIKTLLYIVLLFLAGCEDRQELPLQSFYPFAAVSSIKVSVNNPQYKLFVSQPVDISVQAYDQSGKKVSVPDSLLTLTLNDEPFVAKQLMPQDTGAYVLKAKFANLESTPVTVYSEDVIGAMEIILSRLLFYLREETAPVNISVLVRDKEGTAFRLSDSTQLRVMRDDTPLSENSILPTQAGDYRIRARLRGHESPLKVLRAINPEQVARHIRMSIHSPGGTHLGIANGNTRFEIEAEVQDQDHKALPLTKELKFYANGSPLPGNSFFTLTAGKYTIHARGYGVSSEPREVVMRDVQSYPVVKLPVILHFINQPVPTQNALDKILEEVNATYRGENLNTGALQDPNAVSCYLQFEWATQSPDGKALQRPGVHVVQTQQTDYPTVEVYNAVESNPCWTNFWDPNKYLNVWVIAASDGNWGGLGTLGAPLSDSPVNTPPPYLYGTWVNTTANLGQYVLTHEFGHNMGLAHTFNGDVLAGQENTPEQSCAKDADGCEDTPNYHRASATVSSNERVSCEGIRFVSTNYMDYWPGAVNSFTYDQRTIVRRTLDKGIWVPTPRNRNLGALRTSAAPFNVKPPIVLP